MSLWAEKWAYEQSIDNSGAKFVLVTIAHFADEDGYAWPSQATMSRMTDQGERTVRRNLDALEGMGLIARSERRRPDGSRNSDLIQLRAPADTFKPAAKLAGRKAATGQIQAANTSGQFGRGSEILDLPLLDHPDICNFDPFSKNRSADGGKSTRLGRKRNQQQGIRAVAWTEGFALDAQMRDFARAKGVPNADAEFEAFHQWALAKGAKYVDWRAAWRTRCLKFEEFHPNRNAGGKSALRYPTREELHEQLAEDGRRFQEKVNGKA